MCSGSRSVQLTKNQYIHTALDAFVAEHAVSALGVGLFIMEACTIQARQLLCTRGAKPVCRKVQSIVFHDNTI